MVRYLTGVSNAPVRAVAHTADIGLLVTPDTGYLPQIPAFPYHAADNGCFNHPERSPEQFLRWLKRVPVGLFAPAPDVVGDAQLTLERSRPILPLIRDLGWPAAFVAQDGIEHTEIPWEGFDVLFLGGTTKFKLGPVAREFARQAKLKDKRVHMGRVNSFKRLKLAQEWGCDTVDGTFLAFGPQVNLPKLLKWLERIKGVTPCGQD
jgi:hypothetical protein